MQLRFLVTIPLLAVLTFLGWPHSGHQSLSVAAREPQAAKVGVIPPEVDTANLAAFLEQTAVDAYLAEEGAKVAEYLDALEQTRVAEEEAARRAAAAVANTQRPQPAATTGQCTGFVIPDYIIQRESGGNPSAYNPSGAYGCAQTLLGHYAPGGTCAGDDPYSIDGQRDCVSRLSNGGTNLTPWVTR